jgi:hypothetical protein
MKRQVLVVMVLVGVLALPLSPAAAAAAAEAAAAPLTLGKFVPADVHMYAGGKDSPERNRLLAAYWRAFEKLVDSGIARDIFDLATIEMSPKEREEALSWAKLVLRLVKMPDWEALAQDEVAFAFKLFMPVPEYLVLFKVPKDSVEARRGEFVKMFKEVAALAPNQITVREEKRFGASMGRMSFGGAPIAMIVATKADVVALSTSDRLLGESLRLMDAEKPTGSIVMQGRFREAFEGLPAPEDGLMYFDLAGYLNFLRGILVMAGGAAGGDPMAAGLISIVDIVLEESARMHTVASVDRTEGDRMFSDTRIAFSQEGGESGFFEGLIKDREPLRNYDRVVPRDALTFYATVGIDPEELYTAILGLVRDHMPDGEKLLGFWEKMQAEVGFNLQRDLLSWLHGGGGWVTLPGGPWGTETVLFVRVKDAEKAEAMLERIGSIVQDYLASRGQRIEYVEIPGTEGSLYEIRIEALPFLRPVVGVPSGMLVISSSGDAVRHIVETMRGNAPAIQDNPRFTALGLPEEPVCEVFYQNIENSVAPLANVAGTVGFVLSLLPRDHDTRPVIHLGKILTKAAAFLREIDLGVDYAFWTRYDPEKHAVFVRQMTKVRVPAAEPSREEF